VTDVPVRVHRVAADDVAERIGRFPDDVADPVATTHEQTERAALIRARHYHRRGRAVALAGCVALAITGEDDAVGTSDAPLARVAADEGIQVLLLPNALGRIPRI
jgi:hypothetical protein